jgi:hypothetical protein
MDRARQLFLPFALFIKNIDDFKAMKSLGIIIFFGLKLRG